MTRNVRVLRRARRDLQEIYDLVVREAPLRADPFIDRLLDAINSLSTLSDLVFYKVLKRQVRVYRVLRGSRAYRSLL